MKTVTANNYLRKRMRKHKLEKQAIENEIKRLEHELLAAKREAEKRKAEEREAEEREAEKRKAEKRFKELRSYTRRDKKWLLGQWETAAQARAIEGPGNRFEKILKDLIPKLSSTDPKMSGDAATKLKRSIGEHLSYPFALEKLMSPSYCNTKEIVGELLAEWAQAERYLSAYKLACALPGFLTDNELLADLNLYAKLQGLSPVPTTPPEPIKVVPLSTLVIEAVNQTLKALINSLTRTIGTHLSYPIALAKLMLPSCCITNRIVGEMLERWNQAEQYLGAYKFASALPGFSIANKLLADQNLYAEHKELSPVPAMAEEPTPVISLPRPAIETASQALTTSSQSVMSEPALARPNLVIDSAVTQLFVQADFAPERIRLS
jgi:hypothetical protein